MEENSGLFKILDELITTRVENLKGSLREFEKSILFLDDYNSIKETKDAKKLLELKDEVLKFDSSFKEKIEIIEFFNENNALFVEQVTDIVEEILSSPFFSLVRRYNKEELQDIRNKIIKEIEINEKMLNGEYVDYDYLLSIMFPLAEKDKLSILSTLAYKSCFLGQTKKETKEEVKEEPHQLPDLEAINNKSISHIETLKKEFETKVASANELVKKYYYLLEERTNKQLGYVKAIYDNVISKGNLIDEFNKLEYSEQKLNIALYGIVSTKKIIEDLFKQDKIDEDELTLYMLEFNDLLQVGFEEDKKLEEDKKETEPSKVFFLTDENDNITLNMEVDREFKDQIQVLLQELEEGKYDLDRNKNHSKVKQGNDKVFEIEANRSGKVALSYIRHGDKVILLNAGKLTQNTSFYRKSISLTHKYQDKIEKIIELIESNDKEFIESQDKIKSDLMDVLSKGGLKE